MGSSPLELSWVNRKQQVTIQCNLRRQIQQPWPAVSHQWEIILPQSEVKLSVQHYQKYGLLQSKPSTNLCLAGKAGEAQLRCCKDPPKLTKTGEILKLGTAHLQKHTAAFLPQCVYLVTTLVQLIYFSAFLSGLSTWSDSPQPTDKQRTQGSFSRKNVQEAATGFEQRAICGTVLKLSWHLLVEQAPRRAKGEKLRVCDIPVRATRSPNSQSILTRRKWGQAHSFWPQHFISFEGKLYG